MQKVMNFEYNNFFELKTYLTQSSKLLQGVLIKSPAFKSGYFNSKLRAGTLGTALYSKLRAGTLGTAPTVLKTPKNLWQKLVIMLPTNSLSPANC